MLTFILDLLLGFTGFTRLACFVYCGLWPLFCDLCLAFVCCMYFVSGFGVGFFAVLVGVSYLLFPGYFAFLGVCGCMLAVVAWCVCCLFCICVGGGLSFFVGLV